jgi:D-aminoacyl-tRNA deacylase
MIGLLQRVTAAHVDVGVERVAVIGHGLVVLVGVERGDGLAEAERLAERLLGYRVFPDAAGRMNLSVRDVRGSLLLVPQFTLAADTQSGMRASFSRAAAPEVGAALFDHLVGVIAASGLECAGGRFGAHMRVTLTNDGPVTFWLQVTPPRSAKALAYHG